MLAIFKSTQLQLPGFLQDNIIDRPRFLGVKDDYHVPTIIEELFPESKKPPICRYYYWEVNTKLDAAGITCGSNMNPIIVDYAIDTTDERYKHFDIVAYRRLQSEAKSCSRGIYAA